MYRLVNELYVVRQRGSGPASVCVFVWSASGTVGNVGHHVARQPSASMPVVVSRSETRVVLAQHGGLTVFGVTCDGVKDVMDVCGWSGPRQLALGFGLGAGRVVQLCRSSSDPTLLVLDLTA